MMPGPETDLDLGHCDERFTGVAAGSGSTISPADLFQRAREASAGRLSGQDHPGRPHVTNEIRRSSISAAMRSISCSARSAARSATSRVCRSFEAIRQLGNDKPRNNVIYMHLTLMPFIPASGRAPRPSRPSIRSRSCGHRHPPDVLPRAPTGDPARRPRDRAVLQRPRRR